MIPKDQTNTEPNGNCLAACLASILELEVEDVPDLCDPKSDWWKILQDWLAEKGLFFLSIVLHKNTPWFPLPHHPWAIFIGLSKAGITHACVGKCRGEEFAIVHDPHPNKTGIDRVDNICFIVPLNPATLKIKRILTSSIIPSGINHRRR